MSNPATPNIPLRCGPVGPPFDLAAAVAALGFNGSITRVWSTPDCPESELLLNHGQTVAVQRTTIACTAAQLGRLYLLWWHAVAFVAPPVEGPPLEPQPEHIYAEVMDGNGTMCQLLDMGIKLNYRSGGEDGPESFPWVADCTGSVLIKPGEGGMAPFTVAGPNILGLWLENVDDSVNAIIAQHQSCLLIAEITTPSADAQRIILTP